VAFDGAAGQAELFRDLVEGLILLFMKRIDELLLGRKPVDGLVQQGFVFPGEQ